MNTYEFTLHFSMPEHLVHDHALLDSLHQHGCDDAVVGIGRSNRLSLKFMREAESAANAIDSSIADVLRAVPSCQLIEVAPDLVGLSDMAPLLSVSRQYLRKLMLADGDFPLPAHVGSTDLWYLAELLSWFRKRYPEKVCYSLQQVAEAAHSVNQSRSFNVVSSASKKRVVGPTVALTQAAGSNSALP
jgi:hypothetical protein